jgi:hypothetical protein
VTVDNKEPTANLLVAFADIANANCESLGASTGRLPI